MMTRPDALQRRHEFVRFFDVANGNPNGDPDAGNMPRTDPETGHGLVSDVCLKRKVRNYVEMAKEDAPGYRIYVTEGAILNEKHREAYLHERPTDAEAQKAKKLSPKSDEEAARIRDFMCANFYDIRIFGAVLSTGINAGQVRGPVQFSFGRSVEPVMPLEISVTRITGFSDVDLDLLWTALRETFEHDRSAARGEMTTRKLVVFRHACALGSARAQELFGRVKAWRDRGELVEPGSERLDNAPPARSFADYAITIDRDGLPAGIEVIEY